MAWVRKAPSGRWQARWREPGGRERVRTFRLKADAERFLVATTDAMHRGAYNDPNAGRETLEASAGCGAMFSKLEKSPLRIAAVGTDSTTQGDGSKLQMPS